MVKVKTLFLKVFFSSLLKPCITLIIAFHFVNGTNTDLGSTIPDLRVRLLNGSSTTLHQLSQDGPLLIDFWATWCVPCKKVMKYLNQYHEEYASDNFKVLMINTDTPVSYTHLRAHET